MLPLLLWDEQCLQFVEVDSHELPAVEFVLGEAAVLHHLSDEPGGYFHALLGLSYGYEVHQGVFL